MFLFLFSRSAAGTEVFFRLSLNLPRYIVVAIFGDGRAKHRLLELVITLCDLIMNQSNQLNQLILRHSRDFLIDFVAKPCMAWDRPV